MVPGGAITGTPPHGQVGVDYDARLTVGGSPVPGVRVTGGALPPGLTLDAAGRITGRPTGAGDFSVTVTATNAAGSAALTRVITVLPASSEDTGAIVQAEPALLARTGGSFSWPAAAAMLLAGLGTALVCGVRRVRSERR
ncbi:Ig domain-containing protein [Cellulomonas denverensis]|uniref:Ig domain-containing protein n=1 Tax=Cellulomonas denverensis TaxID=264297 RepID=UPI001A570AF0|nr:Ig domain-containing protein [Cellulomonas denverensis]GIG23804.1 hypothetical protein Cde04nite_00480 [Cellulomonas denverensis]